MIIPDYYYKHHNVVEIFNYVIKKYKIEVSDEVQILGKRCYKIKNLGYIGLGKTDTDESLMSVELDSLDILQISSVIDEICNILRTEVLIEMSVKGLTATTIKHNNKLTSYINNKPYNNRVSFNVKRTLISDIKKLVNSAEMIVYRDKISFYDKNTDVSVIINLIGECLT